MFVFPAYTTSFRTRPAKDSQQCKLPGISMVTTVVRKMDCATLCLKSPGCPGYGIMTSPITALNPHTCAITKTGLTPTNTSDIYPDMVWYMIA